MSSQERQDLATAIDSGFYKMCGIRIANLNWMSGEFISYDISLPSN
jgi:hypothetical protein